MRHALAILILAFSMSIGANRLCAETINIVALGDSNTFGTGQGKTPGGVPVAEAVSGQAGTSLAGERLGCVSVQPRCSRSNGA